MFLELFECVWVMHTSEYTCLQVHWPCRPAEMPEAGVLTLPWLLHLFWGSYLINLALTSSLDKPPELPVASPPKPGIRGE